jgi:NitT/TauT family transport system substrate-binding protein
MRVRLSDPARWLSAVAALALVACATPRTPAPTAEAPPLATSAAGAAPLTGRAAYPAPTDPEVKLRAAWCAVAGAMFPLWVAKESGIFARHRLDVELQFMQGGTPCQAALMNGELDFLQTAGAGTLPRMMTDTGGLLIGNLYMGNPYRLIVAPDIQTVADLRGRKVAISRPGEFDNRLTAAALERHGLVPNQDVTLVPIGGQTDRYTALKGGIVDGTAVNPPINLTARNERYREIYDLADLGIAGLYISLFTTRNSVQTRPRVVERFLAAMVEASAYAKSDKEFTIKVMSDYLKLNDRAALEGAYQAYAQEMLAIPPYVPLDGAQAIIDESLHINPDAPIRDAALLVDNRPLQAVEASGFIAAILAEYPPRRN